jgi:dolichol-phosphate mannosyltransferase
VKTKSASRKILTCVVCYNTAESIRLVLSKIPENRDYDILIVDDGSSDRTPEYIKASGLEFIRHSENRGLGAAIKSGLEYALRNGYDIFVVMAGNDKDDPRQIPRLTRAITEKGMDYVQGSRFLAGGCFETPPLVRKWLVVSYIRLFKWMTGYEGTDPINGFRAYRLEIFNDPRIDVWQDWLNGYSYETYLQWKVLKLGYKVDEVPTTKSYAGFKKSEKYSHVRPILDWWDIVRPLVYLKLRIKS